MNVKQIRGKFADEKYLGPEPTLKPNYTQSELIKSLQEKHGDGVIDIETGEITANQ
jgi:hypothetical protein